MFSISSFIDFIKTKRAFIAINLTKAIEMTEFGNGNMRVVWQRTKCTCEKYLRRNVQQVCFRRPTKKPMNVSNQIKLGSVHNRIL